MMSKLIFLDIDGTLVRPGQTPGTATVDAIRRAQANGHKVFLSTGRMEVSVAENVRAIGFDGGIYGAGGQVVVGGVELINQPMSAALVQRITDVLIEGNIPFKVETACGTVSMAEEPAAERGVDDLSANTGMPRLRVERVLSWMQQPHSPIYKILFSAASADQGVWIRQKLNHAAKVVCFPDLVPGLSWIPGEISDWSINKGKALTAVCRYLGADPGDCIAFGDSMNDAEILQAAGLGIAMGNAEAGVKEIADQVCESCEDEGIAKALVRMDII